MKWLNMCLGLVACLMLATGCSLLSSGSRPEPDTIVVRNATGADIKQVTIWSTDHAENDGPRMASISMVPGGQSATVGRPSNPPPLPMTCRFAWVDLSGRTFAHDVDVAGALKSSTGADGEVMLFEVQTGNRLSVQIGTFR